MPHPEGGQGNSFRTNHTFEEVYQYVGRQRSLDFPSTTGEKIAAKQGTTKDGATPTIMFIGENNRHGNVCPACWGYRYNCSGTRIGHCVEGLDKQLS